MARISQVNQDTHQIIDIFGRTRFFHGTNVVMKEPPWYRPFEWVPGVSSFGEQDVQNLHDLGLNIVRLGHSWAGAEPVRGQYNQTYLDIMKIQTKMAEDHGIYVLVDVHQDLLARQFCGHGVPDWFVQENWVPEKKMYPYCRWPPLCWNTTTYPVDEHGLPSKHSFHYYRPPQIGSISTTLDNRRKDNERLRTAGVLTELTFWMGDGKQMQHLTDAMSATDANMFSWIGWAYENLYNGTSGQPYPELAKHYSRAYPAAVAGTPISFSFNESSVTFKLQFTSDPNIQAPTEIILPPSTFPNGYQIQVSPAGSLQQYTPDKRTLALFTRTKDATNISVTVSRK